MKKFAVALLLSTACAAPALAANAGQSYLSVDYGAATYTNATGFPNPGVLRIAGGAQFTPQIGMEVGYSIFGNSTISGPGGTASIDSTSSLQVLAVGTLPVTPQFEVFGKLGLAMNRYTINVNTFALVGTATYSKNDIMFGIGAKFNVSPQLAIQAQYLDYGAFDAFTIPLKATTATVGVAFNF